MYFPNGYAGPALVLIFADLWTLFISPSSTNNSWYFCKQERRDSADNGGDNIGDKETKNCDKYQTKDTKKHSWIKTEIKEEFSPVHEVSSSFSGLKVSTHRVFKGTICYREF